MGGGVVALQDVDDLAGLCHAEIFPGDLFDRDRGALQALDLAREALVFDAKAIDVVLELVDTPTCLLELRDAPLPEEERREKDDRQYGGKEHGRLQSDTRIRSRLTYRSRNAHRHKCRGDSLGVSSVRRVLSAEY